MLAIAAVRMLLGCCTMSTKKASARQAIEEQIDESVPSVDERRSVDGRVAGEIMSALLTAITFGLLEPQDDTSNQAMA